MADESSLPFFDRTATAAGGFPVARRGYDKHAVDDYVRALEAQLAESRSKVEELQTGAAPLQRQLDEAKRQLEASANPSYAGLGDRAAQILRLAQDQAQEALEEARREAEELRVTAAKEAAAARAAGEREAEDIRTVALNESDSLRRTAEGDAAEIRRTAETEAAEVLAAARRKAEQLQLTAESQSSTLKNGALHEAEKIRTAIQRESAALRARLADEREQQAKELADKHAQIAADTENLTTQMQEAAEASERRVAEATEQARKIRAEAEESAERTLTRARREAEQVLSAARTRAEAELASSADEAERSRTLIARETERLAKRRDGILAQIAGLNDIASNIARQAAELDSETAAPAYSPFARPAEANPFAAGTDAPRGYQPPGAYAAPAMAAGGTAEQTQAFPAYDAPAGATAAPAHTGATAPTGAAPAQTGTPAQTGATAATGSAGDGASGVFTGRSPFAGDDAGAPRADDTRIDTALPADRNQLDHATGEQHADADHPKDVTQVDEFRLEDLANQRTEVNERPFASSAKDGESDRSPKDQK
ncbi:hypothetical protein Kfla_4990 [Kribbella flavida DSM 17836]|uniref:DivIVA family protein n=1 Tax=Kribbella flavida (strain DSM 17836 / JCM 10339 / NBRC 14399) TaxID=479435 RepID=D2Q260_KRIFD|nr:hypothetical protein [Kribbella flavida]ADB34006.1 hypothetical protein Kfla_4990 [Kribbella flavida DSM 17836]